LSRLRPANDGIALQLSLAVTFIFVKAYRSDTLNQSE
jgi:hypothetical protein